MLCLSGFELYSRWVPLKTHFQYFFDSLIGVPEQGSWCSFADVTNQGLIM